jgi:hypothetical protein
VPIMIWRTAPAPGIEVPWVIFVSESHEGAVHIQITCRSRGANAPELSVIELSAALKRTVEDRFGFVRVRGEISNYRGPHTSGHA